MELLLGIVSVVGLQLEGVSRSPDRIRLVLRTEWLTGLWTLTPCDGFTMLDDSSW